MKPQLEGEVFGFLRELIYHHSGIALGEKEIGLVRTRVARRVAALGFGTFEEYRSLLRGPAGAREIPALVDAVTTNYTFFFRDLDHFQFLSAVVIPEILSVADRGSKIRGWSAGCSSGEEAYSIAMTFAEAARNLDQQDFRLLATDINRKVLGIAARAVYSEGKLARVPPDYQVKYLVCDDLTPPGCKRLCAELRERVVFRRLNILQDLDSLYGVFHFVFCRNVMMYFDRSTQVGLVQRLHRCLVRGGYLFTAPPECMKALPHAFVPVSPTIYRKR